MSARILSTRIKSTFSGPVGAFDAGAVGPASPAAAAAGAPATFVAAGLEAPSGATPCSSGVTARSVRVQPEPAATHAASAKRNHEMFTRLVIPRPPPCFPPLARRGLGGLAVAQVRGD